MMRRSPRRHFVKGHERDGVPVSPYYRGDEFPYQSRVVNPLGALFGLPPVEPEPEPFELLRELNDTAKLGLEIYGKLDDIDELEDRYEKQRLLQEARDYIYSNRETSVPGRSFNKAVLTPDEVSKVYEAYHEADVGVIHENSEKLRNGISIRQASIAKINADNWKVNV